MSETPAALPGVLGYVVVCVSHRATLTHSTLMDRESAEREAGQWRHSMGPLGGRYVVCEVREVTG